jgi:hypothetical protein
MEYRKGTACLYAAMQRTQRKINRLMEENGMCDEIAELQEDLQAWQDMAEDTD